jgi:predicted small lipoprotein YifL
LYLPAPEKKGEKEKQKKSEKKREEKQKGIILRGKNIVH